MYPTLVVRRPSPTPSPPRIPLTWDALAAVAEEARRNLEGALDIILVHAEQYVSGRQPRVALNPAIVVTAVGAWERLVADLIGAVTVGQSGAAYQPGLYEAKEGAHHPGVCGRRLRNLGIATRDVEAEWEAEVAFGYRGCSPKEWTRLTLGQDISHEEGRRVWNPEAVDAQVEAAIMVRNGGAHRVVEQVTSTASKRGLPVMRGDADRPTLQNGYARALTALMIQVINSTLVTVAQDHGWDPEPFRLPASWFRSHQVEGAVQRARCPRRPADQGSASLLGRRRPLPGLNLQLPAVAPHDGHGPGIQETPIRRRRPAPDIPPTTYVALRLFRRPSCLAERAVAGPELTVGHLGAPWNERHAAGRSLAFRKTHSSAA